VAYITFILCVHIQDDQKVSVHVTITVQKTCKNTVFKTLSITYHDNVVRIRDKRWPPRSPDLSAPDFFFFLGAMENSLYSNNPHKIDDLMMMAVTEYIRSVDKCCTENGLREHSSACQ